MGKYFYVGKRLALELNGAQTRSILYGMERVLSELDRNELSTSTLLLAANRENSVLKANIARSYSAYGFDDLTSRESLIGFNGEARDGVVGCDLLGNGRRAYSPVLMRFLSPDIMSPFEEGGLNAYMYCEGDPINYSDPSAMGKTPNAGIPANRGRSTSRTSSKPRVPSGGNDMRVSTSSPRNPVSTSGQAASVEVLQLAQNISDAAVQRLDNYESVTRPGGPVMLKRPGGPVRLKKSEKLAALVVQIGKKQKGNRSYHSVARELNPNLNDIELNSRATAMRSFAIRVSKQELDMARAARKKNTALGGTTE